ncbi:hypothetical protein ACFIOY_11805 [Bradyrhizobium sp. TZ2]
MADATGAAFSSDNAALSAVDWGTTDIGMVEILFIAQLARRPLQAMARRWWCKHLSRASRGRRRCPECTKS